MKIEKRRLQRKKNVNKKEVEKRCLRYFKKMLLLMMCCSGGGSKKYEIYNKEHLVGYLFSSRSVRITSMLAME